MSLSILTGMLVGVLLTDGVLLGDAAMHSRGVLLSD
jgi:hypothetical protein